MRRQEVATTAAIILVAAVAMLDSFKKSGWTPSGPDAGWYPFWSAAMMGGAGIAVVILVLRTQKSRPLFNSPEGARAFWKISAPMVIAVLLINWIGFYVMSAGLLGYFGRWIGQYRWHWAAMLAVIIPLVLFLAFEQGFRVPLPKSFLYSRGVTPF